ncbi:RNA polymerase sigma-F factor [Clostridium baratii]|uniref:sigma-70 family RNA polymerase sigma factor n=1 Tax=Clostridium baratii TaxID=1561 RepID=UPI0006C11922|nr:sigma-70 family RNA polymerase sigma factor [Clostridium baratii]CUP24544.1 RNA polymerase sigma-F factor [Clostridium baratii]
MTNEELVVSYQQGNKQALEQLIENNQKFIYKIANKFYTEGISSIDKDDLIQEGTIGFIIACNKYDINNEKKALFSTYAFHWIYSKIHRFITNRDTNEETSLNKTVGEEQSELMDLIENKDNCIENIEDDLYIKELRKELDGVMNQYNTLHEREVLKLYYGWDSEETSIENIADIFETSSSNIKNTKSKAIRKIRSSMWFRAEYNRRYREDITFERVLRNIDLGIGVSI